MPIHEETQLLPGSRGRIENGYCNHFFRCFLITFSCLATIGMTTMWLKHNGLERVGMMNKYTKADQSFKIPKWTPPQAVSRCDWVIDRFLERDKGATEEQLHEVYEVQSTDPNVFFRATAHIFWNDFVNIGWNRQLAKALVSSAHLKGGVPLTNRSLWTWVTGDQHLSNFGAWRNRNDEVVFGVNDFDEAAIYNFAVDILRISVSVYNHGVTNGFSRKKIKKILHVFIDTYVQTVVNYVGNDDALVFELTKKTTSGKLKRYLEKVEKGKSSENQLSKFTTVDEETGERYFLKGPNGDPHVITKLMAVPFSKEDEIRKQFTVEKYGATMEKMGWGVRPWDDNFFTVLDVAQRIGTGIGSYGVPRYYVLLKGTDNLLDTGEGAAVILDVKFEPTPALAQVLTPEETAWYNVMFPNEAARVVEAQRRLTSYTDPYTGWILLNDEEGNSQAYYVHQRSPWKNSPNLDKIKHKNDFTEFMSQVAISTATSHVRGNIAEAPGDFKHAIKALFGTWPRRHAFSTYISVVAYAYHQQVSLDYTCFKNYVLSNYSSYGSYESSDNDTNLILTSP